MGSGSSKHSTQTKGSRASRRGLKHASKRGTFNRGARRYARAGAKSAPPSPKPPGGVVDVDPLENDTAEALIRRFHQFGPTLRDGTWMVTFESVCAALGVATSVSKLDNAACESFYLLFLSMRSGGHPEAGVDTRIDLKATLTLDDFLGGMARWRAVVAADSTVPLHDECLRLLNEGRASADRITPDTVDCMSRLTYGGLPPVQLRPPKDLLLAVVQSGGSGRLAADDAVGTAQMCAWIDSALPEADLSAMRDAFTQAVRGSLGGESEVGVANGTVLPN
mmetsp:Transcript_37398/g.98057  ORF Transcript_37398/g.98057 Transcript_37398/m.98057 type:complete len:279 (-) Transcript_37398:153-989(-)|eukprot:CAMPEP_0182915730 /NCGR_PEP_ID=MMETSP0105_2-20130417/510_1 /TAXON_ID=81532 ORGANISM="Acanthoeca-like sp., Strain 10tr" /NCGR_SAMPLE_ID=MMETSP0105_2 /ASSEMBLY_ACC=CAM_ASM_000205 /LENGTH=278 /DNA_ID=CAMNT_0025052617 /DNA_START=240 /DNA_END=1076 /DNA_ORIENTATION=+